MTLCTPPTADEQARMDAEPKVYGETITTGWRLTSESLPPRRTTVNAYVGQDEADPIAILAFIDFGGNWRKDGFEGDRKRLAEPPLMWAPIASMNDALCAIFNAKIVDIHHAPAPSEPGPDDEHTDDDIPF